MKLPSIKELTDKLNELIDNSISNKTIQNVLFKYYSNYPSDFKQATSRTGKLRPKSFKALESKLNKTFKNFQQASDATKVRRLRKLKIHPRVFLTPPINVVVCKQYPELYKEINQLREDLLFNSYDTIVNMVNSKSMYSTYIDREDIEQWALETSWEATLQYDTKRGTWDTYLVYTLNRSLYKHIAENSRLITLPRWVLSRWSPVGRALKENADNVAETANKKASSSIARKKQYTDDEIQYLDNIINASFENVFLNSNNLGYEPKAQIDVRMLRSNIMEEAQKLLTTDELVCLEHKLNGLKRSEIFEQMKLSRPDFTVNQLHKCHVQIMNKLKESERLKQLMVFIKEEE